MTHLNTDAVVTQSYPSGRGPNRTGVSVSSFIPNIRSVSAVYGARNCLFIRNPSFGHHRSGIAKRTPQRELTALLTIAGASDPAEFNHSVQQAKMP